MYLEAPRGGDGGSMGAVQVLAAVPGAAVRRNGAGSSGVRVGFVRETKGHRFLKVKPVAFFIRRASLNIMSAIIRRNDRFKDRDKRRQVACDNFPDDIFIHAEVIMNDFMAHSGDFSPGYIGVRRLPSR